MRPLFRWPAALLEWLALAYIGYWLALLLDRVLFDALLAPLLGVPVLDWQITPFRVFISSTEPGASGMVPQFLRIGPAVTELLLLAGISIGWIHSRRALPALALNYCGLWCAIILVSDLGAYAWLARGRLARILTLAGLPNTPTARVFVVALAGTLLVAVGAVCARRLFSAFAALAPPGGARRWMAPLLIAVPLLGILHGSLGFRMGFFGARWIFALAIPVVFSLLICFVALRRASGKPSPCAASGGNSFAALAASLSAAFALYIGLAHAGRIEGLIRASNLQVQSTAHYEILFSPENFSREFIQEFAAGREAAFAHISSRFAALGGPREEARNGDLPVRVILHPDFFSKRAATRSDRPYTLDGGTIHALIHGYLTGLDASADAAAFLHAVWGAPGTTHAGQWIAQLLADGQKGLSIEQRAARIESESGPYGLAQLLDFTEDGFISPLARVPLGATLSHWVYQHRGLDGLRSVYQAKPEALTPRGLQIALGFPEGALEASWREWMQKLIQENPPAPREPRLPAPGFFFRGVSLTHEGFGGRGGGYTGPQAELQLRHLSSLGANAISVIPYGFMRGVDDSRISLDSTDETDEEMSQALHVARGLGMKVMLKPQLWVSAGIFTGRIQLSDSDSRMRWFRNYREFILHYARLAEEEGFDLLCIGNELGGMSVYESEWRQIIADVRRVYHGPITYAANWGAEFENLRFWDAVDFAGLNNYYPLATSPATGASDLLPGASALAEKLAGFHARWHKPLLFTEIGYPSVRGGATQPWIEDRARGISPAEQAAAYEAVFQSFADKSWLYGMFWWKWNSNGRGGGPGDPGFTPMGKPAEEVLRTWYRRMGTVEQAAQQP